MDKIYDEIAQTNSFIYHIDENLNFQRFEGKDSIQLDSSSGMHCLAKSIGGRLGSHPHTECFEPMVL